MEEQVFSFLKRNCRPNDLILLALSGGADSMALYTLLLKYQPRIPFKFGVAHIDHGWRKESCQEAKALERLAEKNGHPFHLKKLIPSEGGNWEDRARKERLKFYTQLCKQFGYRTVLLAHHANDQAETVLKRILEGASLFSLKGMEQVSTLDSLELWRPLLFVEKKEILRWLVKEGAAWFEDITNQDPKFLRGRLRKEIFPFIQDHFGKNPATGLTAIGEEAGELKRYLQNRIEPWKARIQIGNWGSSLDLTEDTPLHPFELGFLIKSFCEQEGACISREHLKIAVKFADSKAGNKKISLEKKILFIDRGHLFLPRIALDFKWDPLPLNPGEYRAGPWKLEIHEENMKGEEVMGWKNVLGGKASVYLPSGNYRFELPSQNPSLSKWWSEHKVPAFFRNQIPIITENGKAYHEFLSGKKLHKTIEGKKWMKILLSLDFVS